MGYENPEAKISKRGWAMIALVIMAIAGAMAYMAFAPAPQLRLKTTTQVELPAKK